MFGAMKGIEDIISKYRETSACTCSTCLSKLKYFTSRILDIVCSGRSGSDQLSIDSVFDNVGKELWKKGVLLKAALAFEMAHQIKPDDARYLSHMAAAEYKAGALGTCLDICSEALNKASKDDARLRARLFRMRARVYMSRLELSKSLSELSLADAERPKDESNQKLRWKLCSSFLHSMLDFQGVHPCPGETPKASLSSNEDDESDSDLSLVSLSSDESEPLTLDRQAAPSSVAGEVDCTARPPAPVISRNVALLKNFQDPASYHLPSSELSASPASKFFEKGYKDLLKMLTEREKQLIMCEAIRSLHQKMFESSVLRLHDHFNACSIKPNLTKMGISFTPNSSEPKCDPDPGPNWYDQYYHAQKVLLENSYRAIFKPRYDSAGSSSVADIDDTLESFTFLPKDMKAYQFEKESARNWVRTLGMELFEETFFDSRKLNFERFFGTHSRVKAGKRRKKQKNLSCSEHCTPCWAKQMWLERFNIRKKFEDPQDNPEWEKVGFFGSGDELVVNEESALVHAVAFISLLQCHAHWSGCTIGQDNDVQWMLMQGIALHHDLGHLRCTILPILENMFRFMKDGSLSKRLELWKAKNRASSVAFRAAGKKGIRKEASSSSDFHKREGEQGHLRNWAEWAHLGEVKKEEEFAYRILFRELSLYSLGCQDEGLRKEYMTVMSAVFDKNPLICYCCGPRRILLRSTLARAKLLMTTDSDPLGCVDVQRKVEILTTIVQHRKSSPRSWFRRAKAFFLRDNLKGAEKDCQKALEVLTIPDPDRMFGIEYPENLKRSDKDLKSSIHMLLGDIFVKKAESSKDALRRYGMRQEAIKHYYYAQIEEAHDAGRLAALEERIVSAQRELQKDKTNQKDCYVEYVVQRGLEYQRANLEPEPAVLSPIRSPTKTVQDNDSDPNASGANVGQREEFFNIQCAYERCREPRRDIKASGTWAEGSCSKGCIFTCHKNCWRSFAREDGDGRICVLPKCNGQVEGRILFLTRQNADEKRAGRQAAKPKVFLGESRSNGSTKDSEQPTTCTNESSAGDDSEKDTSQSTDGEEGKKQETAKLPFHVVDQKANGRRYCGICDKTFNSDAQLGIHLSSRKHKEQLLKKEANEDAKEMLKYVLSPARRAVVRGDRTRAAREYFWGIWEYIPDVVDAIVVVLKNANGSARLSEIRKEVRLESLDVPEMAGEYIEEMYGLREVIQMNPNVFSLEKAPYKVSMDPQVAYRGDIDTSNQASAPAAEKVKPELGLNGSPVGIPMTWGVVGTDGLQ